MKKLFPKASKIQEAVNNYKDCLLRQKYDLVIGIDPSLNITGIVILDNGEPVFQGVIKPELGTSISRIHYISVRISEIIESYGNATFLAILEKPFGIMGSGLVLLEINGVIKNVLFERDIAMIQVPQTTLKKFATGHGNAKKCDMVESSSVHYGFSTSQNDIVDAFWLAKLGHCLMCGTDNEQQEKAIRGFWCKFSI